MPRRRPDRASSRPLVANVSRYLPQYRVAFYEKVRPALEARGIDFLYVHGQPGTREALKGDAAELGWETVVHNSILPLGRESLWWQPCLSEVWHADLVIVEQASRLLANHVLDLGRTAGGPRLAYWGHGSHVHADEARGPRVGLKRLLATRADWWFAYTPLSADIIEGLGFPRERITVVENALDTRELTEAKASLSDDEVRNTRTELDLGDGPVVAFSGALYAQKQLDLLVAAVELLRTAMPHVELLVIGDGERAAALRQLAATRPWLHLAGARFGREKVRCLAAADVLALPAAVGLAVLDSFALELPLVTMAGPGQGHELSYITSGLNGVVVDADGGLAAYAAALGAVLGDERLRERLRAGCRKAAQHYTVDNMVERFAGGVEMALETLRRRPAR